MKKYIFTATILLACTLLTKAQTVKWNFDSDFEGWELVSYTGSVSNGIANLTGTQYYSFIRYNVPAKEPIDPQKYKCVAIRLKNQTFHTKARFYWRVGTTYTFEPFDVSSSDTEFNDYYIDLSSNDKWSGDINTIRFDIPSPINTKSIGKTVSIDYIKFLTEKPKQK